MFRIEIQGVPPLDEARFLRELRQHGPAEDVRLEGGTVVIRTDDADIASSIHTDYQDRNLRGVPVTATLTEK